MSSRLKANCFEFATGSRKLYFSIQYTNLFDMNLESEINKWISHTTFYDESTIKKLVFQDMAIVKKTFYMHTVLATSFTYF